jgi:pyruvate dehydrogenase E2 component (dihydrolipoamide acetyltransferase)
MDVRLPRLGEGADSGVIATVFVKEGDTVKKDQPVLELESEKAVATIPAPAAGKVMKILVTEGDEIRVGTLILVLAEDGAGVAAAPARAAEPAARTIDASVGDEREETPAAYVETEPVGPARPDVVPLAPHAPSGRTAFPLVHPAGAPPPASPSLRKIARELGIDLYRVRGSERGGRIVMSDLRAYVQKIQQVALEGRPAPAQATAPAVAPKPSAPVIDFSLWGPVRRQKMTTLRRSISRKMFESWTTVPRVTQFDEVDVTGLLALRKKYASKYEVKKAHLTLTSFALRAVVAVLKKHPSFNASIDESAGEIVFKDYFHIGVAVDTEQGLIVPVLRNVDKKSVLELSVELQDIAEKTRARRVSLEEMQGGTFTISNQGGIGSSHFTPIVNPPEVAILGMGRSIVKPVVQEGKIVQRTIMPIALSYDHRVNDGADAARFMVDLVKEFESIKDADVRI